ncbi:hypothetical protein EDB81DRAFT_768602 [Dactylonectria macrodidyma]|uniref:Uncharacterized protein n=1 Tax=Dactylonectria macrodidyma TaxID=307937 RepID=A0A9P9D2I6_9HYPO|nr:hypothetical protein EDB81DRAFT_768602 [Dactylonectria macrodidyma]
MAFPRHRPGVTIQNARKTHYFMILVSPSFIRIRDLWFHNTDRRSKAWCKNAKSHTASFNMISYFQRRRARKNASTNTASTERRAPSGATFEKPSYLQPSSKMRPRTETMIPQRKPHIQKPLPPLPLNVARSRRQLKPPRNLSSPTVEEFWDFQDLETDEQQPPIHLYSAPASLHDKIATEEASRIAVSYNFEVVFVVSIDLSRLQQYSPHNLCAHVLVAHGLEFPSDGHHLLIPTEMYANFVLKSVPSIDFHDPSLLPAGYETGASLILSADSWHSRKSVKPAVIFSCLSRSRAVVSIDPEGLLRDARGLKSLLDQNWPPRLSYKTLLLVVGLESPNYMMRCCSDTMQSIPSNSATTRLAPVVGDATLHALCHCISTQDVERTTILHIIGTKDTRVDGCFSSVPRHRRRTIPMMHSPLLRWRNLGPNFISVCVPDESATHFSEKTVHNITRTSRAPQITNIQLTLSELPQHEVWVKKHYLQNFDCIRILS